MIDLFNITDHIIQQELSKNAMPATVKSISQMVLDYAKPHAKKTFEHTKNFYGQGANSFAGDITFDTLLKHAFIIKNSYKLGVRSGLSIYHLSHGGSTTHIPFILNVDSASSNLISLGCRGLGHVRQMPALTFFGDACSIAGDILERMNKGESHTRPTFMEIFL